LKIILDTNMLMVPVQFKIDIFSKLHGELYTMDLCVKELEKLSKGKDKDGAAARVALVLLKTKKVKILKGRKRNVDSAIVEKAKDGNYIVATNDVCLIKTLKTYGIKIIRLKQKKILIRE